MEKALLNAIHSLTLVMRCSVFRPTKNQATDPPATRLIFVTNELIHAITSYWPCKQKIESEYEGWLDEFSAVLKVLPQAKQFKLNRAFKSVVVSRETLIGSLESRESPVGFRTDP